MKKSEYPSNLSRRQFFTRFLSEIISAMEQIHGRPQMRLEEIEKLSDEVISSMTPILKPSAFYRLDKNRLLIKNMRHGFYEEVWHFNPSESYMMGFFDGCHTVKSIGIHLEKRFGTNAEISYQEAKAFFIKLARYAVCQPSNTHEGITY